MRVVYVPILILLLTGCTLPGAPMYDQPILPASFENTKNNSAAVPVTYTWWQDFNSPELNDYVVKALEVNHNLIAARERVRQAEASVIVAGAALYPNVSGSSSASIRVIDRLDNNNESASARLSASYEIDYLGANRASLRASLIALENSLYAEDDLQLSIASSVTSGFFTVVALIERSKVAEENLELLLQTMDLVQRQYDAGLVTGFDIASQKSAVASGRASVVSLIENQRRAEYGLAVLLAEHPQTMTPPDMLLFDVEPPEVILGSPIELLENRPDLRRAEADLRGADADIMIARAALFPGIDISGSLSEGDLISVTDIVGSLAGSLSAPLFNAGRLRAGVDRTESRHRELVQNYYQAVLEALREVEEAAVALDVARQREVLLIESRDQALIALRLAQARYAAGADDLLSVLQSQRSALNANDSVVSARLTRLTSAVELYRALGGGSTP